MPVPPVSHCSDESDDNLPSTVPSSPHGFRGMKRVRRSLQLSSNSLKNLGAAVHHIRSSVRSFSWEASTPVRNARKTVRFEDSNLEEVRHFSEADSPLKIQAPDSASLYSPTSCTPAMKVIEFPAYSHARLLQPIRLVRIWFSPDLVMFLGSITVANFPGHKYVALRFTFDDWKTMYEARGRCTDQSAEQCTAREHICFVVSIDLTKFATSQPRAIGCCARYHVRGCEYWDNNDGENFRIQL